MREIGTALRIARSGMLIVRLVREPVPGQMLLDSKKRPVGRVTEVFGPVRSPYASARPVSDLAKSVVGEKVYSRNEAS